MTEREAPVLPRIIGIGAGAGGLEALELLLSRLTPAGLAYVLVLHDEPGAPSPVSWIQQRTPMAVVEVREAAVPVANTIHVVPADLGVQLVEGELRCGPRASAPIDALFLSLAAALGTAAVGVVLSGEGADGSAGLRAISQAGGQGLVQVPVTARHPAMPEAALVAGAGVVGLGPDAIADALLRHVGAGSPDAAPGLHPATLAALLARVRTAFGVDFSGYKLKTIERRIEGRLRHHRLERLDDYLRIVETTADEVRALYDDLLIGVTGFFRDRAPFEVLSRSVLPRLLADRTPGLPVRVWVPACATGEEAYSLAICILEQLGPEAAGAPIQIFATDLDDAALQHARQGLYPADIAVDVSPERLERFFTPEANGYRVAARVRSLVVFARHDLTNDPPFSRLDMVSCRNVLIYLQPELQRRVLRVLHYALRPGGYLLIGTSESVADAAGGFHTVDTRNKLYQKVSGALSVLPAAVPGGRTQTASRAPAPLGARPVPGALATADRLVLERYGPAGVVVSLGFEVVQFRGRTGAYLDPHPGSPSFNLFKLIRPELLVPLRSAVLQAAGEWVAVTTAVFVVGGEGVQVDVVPVDHTDPAQRCLLVLFRPASGAADRAPVLQQGDAVAARMEQLERELLSTREYLETTVQDLQTVNEELQSANEELQTANEELETSREELCSTNEELSTINEDLQSQVTQYASAEDALSRLLAGLSAPVVLLDPDLRLRRCSAAATSALRLTADDLGAPVGRLAEPLGVDIERLVRSASRGLPVAPVRVRCADGVAYMLSIVSSPGGAMLELTRGGGA